MKPSQIRAELLEQHAALRGLIKDVRCAIEERSAREELRGCVERLATALRGHNKYEEGVLRELIKNVDAWGPARVEIMDESHVYEHTEVLAALLGTSGASDVAAAGKGVAAVLGRIESHMAREEEVLLGEDVLRDDDIVIEYIGG